MKHNLVQRGLTEYTVGLLYILGKIIGKRKGYISMGGETVTTMGSEDYTKQKLVTRVPCSKPENRGESLTKFRLHPPPLGLQGPIIYSPTGQGDHTGRCILLRPQTNPPASHHTRGAIPGKFLVTGCVALDPPMNTYRHRGREGVGVSR